MRQIEDKNAGGTRDGSLRCDRTDSVKIEISALQRTPTYPRILRNLHIISQYRLHNSVDTRLKSYHGVRTGNGTELYMSDGAT